MSLPLREGFFFVSKNMEKRSERALPERGFDALGREVHGSRCGVPWRDQIIFIWEVPLNG